MSSTEILIGAVSIINILFTIGMVSGLRGKVDLALSETNYNLHSITQDLIKLQNELKDLTNE